MKKFLFTILILLFTFRPISAQKNDELLKSERVYLNTDRDIYIAGEYLSYTLYLNGVPGQMSKYAYMVLRDRYNLPVIRIRMELKNRIAFGKIYLPDTLRSDVYQMVCYTNWMRNDGEDSFFTKEIIIANRFDKKLERFDSTLYTSSSATSSINPITNPALNENLVINLDKQVFSTREKLIISVDTKSPLQDSISMLAVSVTEIAPGFQNETSVSDYFRYNNKKKEAAEFRQNLIKYQAEVNGSVIDGRITPLQQIDNQPVFSNENNKANTISYTVLVSTPDSIANMQYAKTDSSGSFRFLLSPYYEGKELIIRLKENARAVIDLNDKFKLYQPYVPSDLLNRPDIRPYLIRRLNISEVQRYYTEKAETYHLEKNEGSLAVPRVYYRPYSKVFPADYLPLPDFIEISRELLPAFKVRKINDKYFLSFIDTQNRGLLNLEPIIFLDGVPINDVNQIINLGTNQIKHIDMLPVIRYYGEMSLPGILAVYSKNLEINNIQFPTPTIRYQAISSQNFTRQKHYLPVDANKHIPDLRQVLLWDPEIKMVNKENLQIECYTSDLHGKYRIRIEGITSSGLPLSGSATITVKSKSD